MLLLLGPDGMRQRPKAAADKGLMHEMRFTNKVTERMESYSFNKTITWNLTSAPKCIPGMDQTSYLPSDASQALGTYILVSQ